jgi:hypothetical protein
MSFILRVSIKFTMLSGIMLSVVMLDVGVPKISHIAVLVAIDLRVLDTYA